MIWLPRCLSSCKNAFSSSSSRCVFIAIVAKELKTHLKIYNDHAMLELIHGTVHDASLIHCISPLFVRRLLLFFLLHFANPYEKCNAPRTITIYLMQKFLFWFSSVFHWIFVLFYRVVLQPVEQNQLARDRIKWLRDVLWKPYSFVINRMHTIYIHAISKCFSPRFRIFHQRWIHRACTTNGTKWTITVYSKCIHRSLEYW